MTNLLRKVIQNQAERVAKDAGFASLPVCPIKIADNADIQVQAKPASADGVSGMFLKVGDKFGILYSTNIQSVGFQNFSIGHELGHYFLPGHAEAVLKMGPHSSRAGFVSSDKFEREADQFSAALLMPEDAFRLAMRSSGVGMAAIEKLSNLAKTSLPATAFRFHELTRDAVAVILSTGNIVDVCFYSDRFKDFKPPFIKKGATVSHSTLTHQFNRDESKILGAVAEEEQTRFTDWFGLDGPTLREQVKGLGAYGKTLTMITADVKSDDDFDPDEQADDEEFLRDSWTPKFRR
jgi:Zn-dependent peptidase ImmA (M78 family)